MEVSELCGSWLAGLGGFFLEQIVVGLSGFGGLCLWRHTDLFALTVRVRVALAETKASSFSVPQKLMYSNCKSYSFVITSEIANPGVQTPSV